MTSHKHFLAALCAAMSLSAGTALAQDKNPLMPPKQAPAKAAPDAPPAPSPDMKLPPAANPSAQPLGGAGLANVGQHLGGLNVVAIVGAKAILRGSIGKSTNFALGSSSDGGEGTKQGGTGQGIGAPVPAGGADEGGKGPAVTVVVTHAQPLQLGDGVWVRPDVAGTTVRLYQQPSKDKANAGEVLVYAASLETLSPTAPLAADKGDDKKQDGTQQGAR